MLLEQILYECEKTIIMARTFTALKCETISHPIRMFEHEMVMVTAWHIHTIHDCKFFTIIRNLLSLHGKVLCKM
jgi:hypothetical protein